VTTEQPDPGVSPGSASGLEAGPSDASQPADDGDSAPVAPEQATRRRRTRRRAERAGTNPGAEDVPDVVAPRGEPEPGETQHDRWLREQRPPHWE